MNIPQKHQERQVFLTEKQRHFCVKCLFFSLAAEKCRLHKKEIAISRFFVYNGIVAVSADTEVSRGRQSPFRKEIFQHVHCQFHP